MEDEHCNYCMGDGWILEDIYTGRKQDCPKYNGKGRVPITKTLGDRKEKRLEKGD